MLGITILPEYIQSEGPEALLDKLLERLPLSAVSTAPYVMAECSPSLGGKREPPSDSDKGLARMLDRPLWGKHEVWITTSPSFEPNLNFYKGIRYQPPPSTELTRQEGPVVDRFIEAAHDRGIKVYFQIQAAIPPGFRVQFGVPSIEDMPRLPDGNLASKRLDNNGSLASPEIIDYGVALISDLLTRYPNIDGIRPEWPEYPPYFMESVFVDFCDHARVQAESLGYNFEGMRRDVGNLYRLITEELDDSLLEAFLEDTDSFLETWDHCKPWLDFKGDLVFNLLRRFREAMDESGGSNKVLFPNAFPPPWNHLSGFDYRKAGMIADEISCKYYTMHWPMMLRNYGESLREGNPLVSDKLIAASLAKAFNPDSGAIGSCMDFHYPEPAEIHPVNLKSMEGRQKQVQSWADTTIVWPVAHAYGPVSDFIKRAAAVQTVSQGRLWVNRYAYLSDNKLEALAELFR